MKFIYLILFVVITNCLFAQRVIDIKKLHSEFATLPEQNKYIEKLDDRINNIFSDEHVNEKKWTTLLLELDLAFYKNDKVFNALNKIISKIDKYSLGFRRIILTSISSLYPNTFYDQVYNIFLKTNDVQLYIMASKYLLSNKRITEEKILNKMDNRFANLNDRRLDLFEYELTDSLNKPNISSLLSHQFQKGKTIIYSLFRKDRKYPGITIIKKPDGDFVKNKDDSIFHIHQLGLSTSEMPGYVSKGNTPQGIFSIVGSYISPTKSIGPTDNVLTRIPFGKSPKTFFHGKNKYEKWNIDDYKNLLPLEWQDYLPIYEAFYAGKYGRRLIVMHGTTDNLDFYKDKPYYPLTPTMGCISAKEIWNQNSGWCIESDQAKLMNAFYSTGQRKGFLVVVNIDNKNEAVSIKEIEELLNKNTID